MAGHPPPSPLLQMVQAADTSCLDYWSPCPYSSPSNLLSTQQPELFFKVQIGSWLPPLTPSQTLNHLVLTHLSSLLSLLSLALYPLPQPWGLEISIAKRSLR